MSRFVQAISEGDGISVVPLLSGDIDGLARAAAEAGAEAVAVDVPDRRGPRPRVASRSRYSCAGASAGPWSSRTRTRPARTRSCWSSASSKRRETCSSSLHERSLELGFACAIAVQDEEELALALERVDPDIVAISCPDAADEQEELERTLDVLPDVPVGKLVIAEARSLVRQQAVALERAGVDAILVADVATGQDFARALADLVGDVER